MKAKDGMYLYNEKEQLVVKEIINYKKISDWKEITEEEKNQIEEGVENNG